MESAAGLFDREARSTRYYRNAVERHWDPETVDLAADARALERADPETVRGLYVPLAKFGVGEASVTADLAPLATVLDSVEDQLFVATQVYEEAKHTDFFDRYWREVVHPAERAHGLPATSPTADRWVDDAYEELFVRTQAAMDRLLTDDSPEIRARAYCHYHLIVEGVLAQTGYYGLSQVYGGDHDAVPALPGLVEGLRRIRQDEGRHVGFGMAKLDELVHEAGVDPALVETLTDDLLSLVAETVRPPADAGSADAPLVLNPDELSTYALEKHADRLAQITDTDRSIPSVDSLTALED
jgi:ribonucleoside-diphosphate reductase beta chain